MRVGRNMSRVTWGVGAAVEDSWRAALDACTVPTYTGQERGGAIICLFLESGWIITLRGDDYLVVCLRKKGGWLVRMS
jgi:hypothetical protein